MHPITLLAAACPLQAHNLNDAPIACELNPPNRTIPEVILDNPDDLPEALFGASAIVLDFDGDGAQDLAVGAPGAVPAIAGRVYLFLGPDAWTAAPIAFESTAPERGDRFGAELVAADLDGADGDELIVGSPATDVGGVVDAGRVYVWAWDAGTSTPIQLADLSSSSAYLARGAALGHSIVVGDFLPSAGLEIAASAPYAPEIGTTRRCGVVHVFSDVLAARRELVLVNPNPSSIHELNQFGTDLARGDWNRDGRQDVVVAAIYNDVTVGTTVFPAAGQAFVYPHPVEPSVFVVLDNPTPDSDPPVIPFQQCSYQRFAQVVAAADVDGDGFDEVAVSSSRKDFENPCPGTSDRCDMGKGYLFSARRTPPTVPRTSFEHPRPRNCDLTTYRLEFCDIVGDATPDLVVGCLIASSVGTSCGSPVTEPVNTEVMLIWNGDSLSTVQDPAGPPDFMFYVPDDHGPHFHRRITSGDLDGQGKQDLILGDDDYSSPAAHFTGRVLIAFWP